LVGYLASDLKPYSTLSYANGPGSINGYGVAGGSRVDLTDVDTSNNSYNSLPSSRHEYYFTFNVLFQPPIHSCNLRWFLWHPNLTVVMTSLFSLSAHRLTSSRVSTNRITSPTSWVTPLVSAPESNSATSPGNRINLKICRHNRSCK
jgi:hypothetical protein